MGAFKVQKMSLETLMQDLGIAFDSVTKKISIIKDLKSSMLFEIEQVLKNNPILYEKLIGEIKEFDEDTYKHTIAVTILATIFGALGGYNKGDLIAGAFLHDTGKKYMPKGVIGKKEDLTAKEIETIKTHPREGYNYLTALDIFNDVVLDTVLHHHERWDGEGYPDKLKGDEIKLPTMVVKIADAYEAMAFGRPYREALPEHVVKKELGISGFEGKLLEAISSGLRL